ncbi:MAG: peptidyl-prolyl cis-trans isomerase [Gammaproteobacteria bacterium]|nr:peptidyl-prolyl cis-trans isomerase [Gammaproteobacteria bacterium]
MSEQNPKVKMNTSHGTLVMELWPDKAPKTVENFLTYVRDGFFDGTIFHRSVPNFVIQGGGYTADYEQKATRAPIENEADNGAENKRGTLCMARTGDPHSATSQFFINIDDNHFLDFKEKSPQGWGYAVFGKLVESDEVLDVLDAIAALPTGPGGPFPAEVPREPVIIQSAAEITE